MNSDDIIHVQQIIPDVVVAQISRQPLILKQNNINYSPFRHRSLQGNVRAQIEDLQDSNRISEDCDCCAENDDGEKDRADWISLFEFWKK